MAYSTNELQTTYIIRNLNVSLHVIVYLKYDAEVLLILGMSLSIFSLPFN